MASYYDISLALEIFRQFEDPLCQDFVGAGDDRINVCGPDPSNLSAAQMRELTECGWAYEGAGWWTLDTSQKHKVSECTDHVTCMRKHMEDMIADFFAGDQDKAGLWWRTKNPLLGGLVPEDFIEIGEHQHRKLLGLIQTQLEENEK